MTAHKLTKANAIAICAKAIGNHVGVRADRVASRAETKAKDILEARSLLIYHLYDCGMSYAAIGRLMNRSIANVREREAVGAVLCMNPDTMACMESLPRIPTTLLITPSNAKGHAPLADSERGQQGKGGNYE